MHHLAQATHNTSQLATYNPIFVNAFEMCLLCDERNFIMTLISCNLQLSASCHACDKLSIASDPWIDRAVWQPSMDWASKSESAYYTVPVRCMVRLVALGRGFVLATTIELHAWLNADITPLWLECLLLPCWSCTASVWCLSPWELLPAIGKQGKLRTRLHTI